MVDSLMRESDHFYSELEGIARRIGAGGASVREWRENAKRAFCRLASPIVGETPAEDLFSYWLDTYGGGEKPRFEKLGHMLSFLLGDYDDAGMDLIDDDWTAIRDIIAAEADEMDLEELTRLMTDLVARGALS